MKIKEIKKKSVFAGKSWRQQKLQRTSEKRKKNYQPYVNWGNYTPIFKRHTDWNYQRNLISNIQLSIIRRKQMSTKMKTSNPVCVPHYSEEVKRRRRKENRWNYYPRNTNRMMINIYWGTETFENSKEELKSAGIWRRMVNIWEKLALFGSLTITYSRVEDINNNY